MSYFIRGKEILKNYVRECLVFFNRTIKEILKNYVQEYLVFFFNRKIVRLVMRGTIWDRGSSIFLFQWICSGWLEQIEEFYRAQGLDIVGYFHANERFDDIELGNVARNIGDHIHRYFPQAALLLVGFQLQDNCQFMHNSL